MPPKKGTFVALEGIDGCGKSTLAKALLQLAESDGYMVTVTEEPTQGHWGKMARAMLNGEILFADDLELQQTFAEDRFDHIARVITPALNNCDLVICDRYWLSTLAYGMSKGLTLMDLIYAHVNAKYYDESRRVIDFMIPDVTIILKLDPEAAWRRIKDRSPNRDYFTARDSLGEIGRCYDTAGEMLPLLGLGEVAQVAASGSNEEVSRNAMKLITTLLAKGGK